MADGSKKRKAITRDSISADEVVLSDGSAEDLEGAFANGFIDDGSEEIEDSGTDEAESEDEGTDGYKQGDLHSCV